MNKLRYMRYCELCHGYVDLDEHNDHDADGVELSDDCQEDSQAA